MAGAPLRDGYTVTQTPSGPILEFTVADYVVGDQSAIPTGGWHRAPAGLTLAYDQLTHVREAPKVMWARMRFEGRDLGADPLAVFTQGNRDHVRLFLNSAEIYRDYATSRDQISTAYQPKLIPVPQGLVRAGANELIVSVLSHADLGTGTFEIGPQRVLASKTGWMNLWRIDLPRKVNFAMLLLAYGAFLFWIFGRREFEFIVIGASSFLWFISNYPFLFDQTFVGERNHAAVPVHFLFLAASATLLLCTEFVEQRRRTWVLATIATSAVLLVCIYVWVPQIHVADIVSYLVSLTLFAMTTGLSFMAWRLSRSIEHLMLGLILTFLTLGTVHDFGRLWYVHAWEGLGFFLQPFDGFLLCIAFLASFGRRSARAFSSLRLLNTELEDRIEQARGELAISEAKRRELEVTRAIETERERLLREMHDGIGSNLVTALRIAEQQQQGAATIKTLRRAISDLKITIDSLEPVEGDLVALLANLRHRMEADLRDAGLICRWRVEACRPLAWLDATNALHVLRIFQEAIGNVLAHAKAGEVEIGCHEADLEGRPGLTAYVLDNGRGFDNHASSAGKGLSNMHARARTLHGHFDCVTELGAGTRISIWLPFKRDVI